MRSTLTLGKIFVLICVVASAGQVQADEPAQKPGGEQAAANPSPKDVVKLRAEMHRTMAALIEAQAAEKPDPAKIKELTDRLQSLRGEIWGRGPGGSGMGGPAAGGGRGRGPGMGYGRGYGPGRGYGYGRGAGGGGWGGRVLIDENNNGICDYYEAMWGQK